MSDGHDCQYCCEHGCTPLDDQALLVMAAARAHAAEHKLKVAVEVIREARQRIIDFAEASDEDVLIWKLDKTLRELEK